MALEEGKLLLREDEYQKDDIETRGRRIDVMNIGEEAHRNWKEEKMQRINLGKFILYNFIFLDFL